MSNAADTQASLEADLKDEIIRMYEEVAEDPDGEFHFYHGRDAAERFGYDPEWLDKAPQGSVSSFAGVGNPHERSDLKEGETVLVLEAMKMEMAIAAPADGTISEILVEKGDQVTAGQVLATLD